MFATPLKWTYGDDLANVDSLIEVSTANTMAASPESADVRYDFGPRAFRTVEGQPVSDEMLDGWALAARRVRKARIGRTTLKRAILLNTLARSESGKRPGLLALVLRQSGELVDKGGLKGVLYSRRDAGGPGVGVPGGLASLRNAEVGLEIAASGLNLFELSGEIRAPCASRWVSRA